MGEKHINTGIIYMNIADAYLVMDNIDEALKNYQRSLSIATKINKDSDIINYLEKKILSFIS